MRSSVSGRLAGLPIALLAVLGLAGACSSSKSFVVLDLRSADTTEIHDVMNVVVAVTQAPTYMKTLTYPTKDGKPLVVNQTNVNNLSVSFSGARAGAVQLEVKLLNSAGCVVGAAHQFSTIIRQGGVANAVAFVQAQGGCTTLDGGTDAQESDARFPGCDPVPPTCAAGQTCQVNCMTSSAECTTGGTHAAGQPCTSNKDCAPGTQCFDYAGTGCAVKICLRFCDNDQGCGGARDAGADGGGADGGSSSAGVGTRSVCQGPVLCNNVATAYHTCTFACDPRLTAEAGNATGCPAGLSCLVVGGMDQVDCACAEASRTKTEGMDCASGSECAPGYICNIMAGTKKCRAVCRCDAKAGVCSATNECMSGKTCTALENETTFGVCL